MGPFTRLFAITGAVLLSGFCAVFMLRLVGLSQPAPNLEIRDLVRPAVFARGESQSGPIYSKESLEAIPAADPQVVVTLEVRATMDRQWVIYGSGDLSVHTDSTGAVESKTLEELKRVRFKDVRGGEGLVTLAEYLKGKELPRLLLIIHNREVAASQTLLEILERRDLPLLTFVFSPNHRLNRELRKKRPWWHSGVDNVTLAQWHVLGAIGLEPFIGSEYSWMPKGLFSVDTRMSPRIQAELARRHFGFLVADDSSVTAEAHTPPLGIMTDRPLEVLQQLRSE